MDRERERKIVEQGRAQGKSDEFIKQAVIRDRQRSQQTQQDTVMPQPKTATNWASNVPVLKQAQDFGIGVGSAIGNAGIGLGQAALKAGIGAGNFMNKVAPGSVDNSFAQRTYDTLEKGKQGIFNKPFEGNLQTMSGKGGQALGNLAPYFAGGGVTQGAKLSFGTLLPRAKAALPYIAPDMVVAAGQSAGDVKTTAVTGLTSLVGGSILPTALAPIKQKIATGATTGYVGDVATGLAGFRGEDRTGGKAFIPGMGTAFGTALGIAQTAPQMKQAYKDSRATNTYNKRGEALESLRKGYRGLDKVFANADASGIDTNKVLRESDLLVNAVDTNGVIDTKSTALPKLNDMLEEYEPVVGEALKKEGKFISLIALKNKLLETIDNAGLVGSLRTDAIRKANADLKDLARIADSQGNIPLARVHDLKVQTNRTNAKSFIDPEKNKIGKTLGLGLKEFVEDSSDVMDVGGYNAELRKFYALRNVLEALNGKRVEGGRLGKYFAQTVGAVVGNAIGGPLGAIGGAEAGSVIKGQQMKGAFGGTQGEAIQPTETLKKGLETSKNVMPQSNILGSRNTTQSTTMAPTTNVIPKTVAQSQSQSRKLSTGVRQSSSIKYTPESVNVAKAKLQEMREAIRISEEVLSQDPASALMKYRGKGDSTLSEMNAKALGTNAKSKGLDDIVTELGYEDLDDAQRGLERYLRQKEQIKVQKENYKRLAKEVQQGEDVLTYDSPEYQNIISDVDEPEYFLNKVGQPVSSPKSTTRKLWDSITGKDIPNKEGGMINVGAMADDLKGDKLVQEAKKYKSAEEFVKAQTGYDKNFGEFKKGLIGDKQILEPSYNTQRFSKEFNGKPTYLFEALDYLKIANNKARLDDIKAFYGLDKIIKNDALFEKYPSLKDINVVVADFHTLKKRGYQVGGKIYLNSKFIKNEKELYSTLVHEVQHLKQDITNKLPKYSAFESGGNMNTKQYAKDAREIDARRKQMYYAQQNDLSNEINRISRLGGLQDTPLSKSQLTDIWNKANKSVMPKVKDWYKKNLGDESGKIINIPARMEMKRRIAEVKATIDRLVRESNTQANKQQIMRLQKERRRLEAELDD